jgi:formylglycine-generating enzyme required for sulfatase activity
MGQVNAAREAREIRDKLRATAHRDSIEFVERFAVRPGDLQQAFFEVRPHIVHFSAHGTTDEELVLENDDGGAEPLGKRALADIFRIHKDQVRVVVLNACHSRPQVEAISEHIDCAIGMRRAIGSQAATEFAAAFYLAIGFGSSVQKAFESAVAELRAKGIPEDRTPQLVLRPGVDAAQVLLLTSASPPDASDCKPRAPAEVFSNAAASDPKPPPPAEPSHGPKARARRPLRWTALLLAGGALAAAAFAVALSRPRPSTALVFSWQPPEVAPTRIASPPPDMVRVPAGRFTMGSATGKPFEQPPHEVTLTRAFEIDRTEVTVAEYQRCVQAGTCTQSGVHGRWATEKAEVEKRRALCTAADPAKARHPITCVDRAQAEAYCAFAGKRLPTEAEWELAARGTDGRAYPWGNEAPGCERANVSQPPNQGCGSPRGTLEVGSLPAGASPFGALDMAGNTWEWVADGWDPRAYSKGARSDPLIPTAGAQGVLRGGSWDFDPSMARATARLAFDRGAGELSTGFRCARTAE